MPSNYEGNLATPRVDEAGPAGVQSDVVSILTAQAHWWVLEWRLSRILQYYSWQDNKTTFQY